MIKNKIDHGVYENFALCSDNDIFTPVNLKK